MESTKYQKSEQTSLSRGEKVKQFLWHNLLLILLLISLGLGVGVGAALRSANLDEREQMYFRFAGDLLMRMLKMLIIPLIVSSLVSGLAGLDAKASGRMGLRAVVYYMSTTFIAVVLGIILVISIKPGERATIDDDDEKYDEAGNVADSFLDLLRYVHNKVQYHSLQLVFLVLI